MNIGDVYSLSGANQKVIMFDEFEVYYDELIEDDKLKYSRAKTTFYTRTPRVYFDTNSVFVKHSKFTIEEEEVHRPDLPLRLNNFKQPFWSSETFSNINDFKSFLNVFDINTRNLKDLNTKRVVIYPSGQQQSLKKPILLENNTGSFLGVELLYRCFEIQREYVKVSKPYFSRFRLIQIGREEKRLSGIGLYRLGIKGNIPSYYLGGYMSSMELESDETLIV